MHQGGTDSTPPQFTMSTRSKASLLIFAVAIPALLLIGYSFRRRPGPA